MGDPPLKADKKRARPKTKARKAIRRSTPNLARLGGVEPKVDTGRRRPRKRQDKNPPSRRRGAQLERSAVKAGPRAGAPPESDAFPTQMPAPDSSHSPSPFNILSEKPSIDAGSQRVLQKHRLKAKFRRMFAKFLEKHPWKNLNMFKARVDALEKYRRTGTLPGARLACKSEVKGCNRHSHAGAHELDSCGAKVALQRKRALGKGPVFASCESHVWSKDRIPGATGAGAKPRVPSREELFCPFGRQHSQSPAPALHRKASLEQKQGAAHCALESPEPAGLGRGRRARRRDPAAFPTAPGDFGLLVARTRVAAARIPQRQLRQSGAPHSRGAPGQGCLEQAHGPQERGAQAPGSEFLPKPAPLPVKGQSRGFSSAVSAQAARVGRESRPLSADQVGQAFSDAAPNQSPASSKGALPTRERALGARKKPVGQSVDVPHLSFGEPEQVPAAPERYSAAPRRRE